MKTKDILKLKFKINGVKKAVTVKEGLKTLLWKVWGEGKCFSAEAPFGTQDWHEMVYGCLIRNNVIEGSFTGYGAVDKINGARAGLIIKKCIKKL